MLNLCHLTTGLVVQGVGWRSLTEMELETRTIAGQEFHASGRHVEDVLLSVLSTVPLGHLLLPAIDSELSSCPDLAVLYKVHTWFWPLTVT